MAWPIIHILVRRQSLAGMTLRLQLPRPACLQPGCSHSPSRHRRQGHRGRAKDRARVSRHRTRPSSTPLCPLAMDTLVCRTMLVCLGFPQPSSTAPPSLCLLLQPNNLEWAWPTPPTSTTNSISPVMDSMHMAQPLMTCLKPTVGNTVREGTEALPSHRPNQRAAAQGKHRDCQGQVPAEEYLTWEVRSTAKHSHLTSRASTQGHRHPSACPQHWGERGP